jgi:DNA-binding CsgD family transcriptional regulator
LAQTEVAWLAGDRAAMQRAIETATRLLDDESDALMYGAVPLWRRRAGLTAEPNDRMPEPQRLLFDGDWQASAEAWAALDCPYERGLALLDSGDHQAMLEAVRVFDDLGAKATVARAQAILRQQGVRSIPRGRRADTRENKFGLTAREQEVLGLVAEGLTNADISRRLVIAEKTVDNHVSSLLAKMGVDSRRDAARLALETDAALATQK